MVERHGDGGGPTVEETAAFVGWNLWLDRRLFELVGGWVRSVPEPAVKAHLDAQARHHAWHAQLWEERMPVTSALDPDDFVVATPGSAVLLARLDEVGAAGGSVERLAGLARAALPRLVVARRAHLARCTPWADAALARSLRFALQDGLDDGLEGEALLQGLLVEPLQVALAAEVQGVVEGAIVEAGGLPGHATKAG